MKIWVVAIMQQPIFSLSKKSPEVVAFLHEIWYNRYSKREAVKKC